MLCCRWTNRSLQPQPSSAYAARRFWRYAEDNTVRRACKTVLRLRTDAPATSGGSHTMNPVDTVWCVAPASIWLADTALILHAANALRGGAHKGLQARQQQLMIWERHVPMRTTSCDTGSHVINDGICQLLAVEMSTVRVGGTEHCSGLHNLRTVVK